MRVLLMLLQALVVASTTTTTTTTDATPTARRGVVFDYSPHSERYGMLRRSEDLKIVSRIPPVEFQVFDPDVTRRRQRYLQQEDDDFILDEIPEVEFVIDNHEDGLSGDGDVCSIGCEGDYSNIYDVLTQLAEEEDGAEYELFFTVQGRYAVAAGVIYDNFPDRIQELHDEQPEVDTIILVECPGSANDEAMIPGSILVHELGYQTCVPSDGHTASGGTDFFTAGVQRYATPGAQIGIHSWAYWDDSAGRVMAGSDLPRDHPEHELYLKFYDEICIPQEFYWKTLQSGLPMHYITEEEFETTFPYLRDCTSSNGCNSEGNSGDSSTATPTTEQTQQTISIVGQSAVLTLDPKDIATFLEGVNAELEHEGIRGAAYAFKGPGMKESILGSYGFVSGSLNAPKVTTDTAFMLASISKTIIGAALAVLVEQGQLDLDDDICNVTGTLTIHNGCRNPHFPKTPVTWRMLINHRSSLIDNIPDVQENVTASYGPTGVNIGKEDNDNPNYGVEVVGNPSCPIDDLERFYDSIFLGDQTNTTTVGNLGGYQVDWYQVGQDAGGGLWNDTVGPGEVHSYSNFATAYIGALLEKLTGEKFEQFTRDHIFAPAGMNHTAWFRKDLPNKTLEAIPVYGYDNMTEEWEDVGHYCFVDYPNGQLHSTIRDMAAYADALLNYGVGTFWTKETADTNFVGCQEKDETGTILDDDSCENALSWFRLSNDTRDDWDDMFVNLDWTNGIIHDGGETGVATNAMILPESGTYAIVLTNTNGADTDYLTWFVSNLGMDLLENSGVISAERRKKMPNDAKSATRENNEDLYRGEQSNAIIREGDVEAQFISGSSNMPASSRRTGVFWLIFSCVLFV